MTFKAATLNPHILAAIHKQGYTVNMPVSGDAIAYKKAGR